MSTPPFEKLMHCNVNALYKINPHINKTKYGNPFTHTPGSPPPIKIEDESCKKALIYFMMKWIYLNLLVMETCFQNHPQTVH